MSDQSIEILLKKLALAKKFEKEYKANSQMYLDWAEQQRKDQEALLDAVKALGYEGAE